LDGNLFSLIFSFLLAIAGGPSGKVFRAGFEFVFNVACISSGMIRYKWFGFIVVVQELKKKTIGQTLKRRLQKPEIKGRKGKRAKAGWRIKNQITRKKGSDL
jgi:hypothetical protein